MTSHRPTTYSYPHTPLQLQPSTPSLHIFHSHINHHLNTLSRLVHLIHYSNFTNLLPKMGGNEVDGYFTIQRALEIARNSEGVVDPTVSSCLERSLRDVWARLEADPDNYILTKDEFALFNYFRHRFTNSNTAQRAVHRFWDHYHGDPRELQPGYAPTNTQTSRS
jgi:hypothetical protein